MKNLNKNNSAFPIGKEALSKAGQAAIANFSNRKPIQFLFQLSMAWAIIILAVYLAVFFNNILITILAIIIIATRQNVLGLLIHEQTHCLGFKARFGDKLTNFFAAYPLIVLTVEGYSQAHLSHHKFDLIIFDRMANSNHCK